MTLEERELRSLEERHACGVTLGSLRLRLENRKKI
jgi:hypothetical protein